PAGTSTMIRLVAPAACASSAKRSQPYASRIDAYVIGTSGVSPTSARVRARHSRHARVRMPCASAFSPARRITGPSASGSETGEPDDDQLGIELACARERMRRLERRDDSLRPRELTERRERLVVSRRDVLGAAGVPQERVLRPDSGVVQPGGDRMCVLDLSVV